MLPDVGYGTIAAQGKAPAAIRREAQQLLLTEADCATLPARRDQLVKDQTQMCENLRAAEQLPARVQVRSWRPYGA
jgi:hypothetical protein